MPNYEHVFICRQDLTSVQAETLAEEFKGTLTENGGKVIESEYWGLRSIAYRMNKNRKGHYFMFKSFFWYKYYHKAILTGTITRKRYEKSFFVSRPRVTIYWNGSRISKPV